MISELLDVRGVSKNMYFNGDYGASYCKSQCTISYLIRASYVSNSDAGADNEAPLIERSNKREGSDTQSNWNGGICELKPERQSRSGQTFPSHSESLLSLRVRFDRESGTKAGGWFGGAKGAYSYHRMTIRSGSMIDDRDADFCRCPDCLVGKGVFAT